MAHIYKFVETVTYELAKFEWLGDLNGTKRVVKHAFKVEGKK